jgi:hypothetical protein
MGFGQVNRDTLFYHFPHNTFFADRNLLDRAVISPYPAIKLQVLSLLKHTSSPHAYSLVDVIEAGLDKIFPVRTPAYQTGNFNEILVSVPQILLFIRS